MGYSFVGPATACDRRDSRVANQQALHLIRHVPAWLQNGKPVPSFRFRDLGALVALSDYNAFGTLGRFGFFTGRFIKGQFARVSETSVPTNVAQRVAPRDDGDEN